MPLPSQEELVKRAVSFVVVDGNETRSGDSVIVERRAEGKWSVVFGGCVMARDGFREYQGFNSNLTDAFKKRTRFTLEEAWDLAERSGRETQESYNHRLTAKLKRNEKRKEARKAAKVTPEVAE